VAVYDLAQSAQRHAQSLSGLDIGDGAREERQLKFSPMKLPSSS
jgi:hypothetical protein